MALPSKVSLAAVQEILTGAGTTGPAHWLATHEGRPQVANALVFAASQFMDEQLMFYLLAKAYEARPSREAMLWIYERFVKPPKVNGKMTVSANLNDASRTVNIPAKEADRTFELVTGAWAKTLPGGAHPRAFGDAVMSMRLLLSDIDGRFRSEVGKTRPAGRTAQSVEFSAYAGRLRLVEEELLKARQFNLVVT
jgi:hypothetical protein